MSHPTKVHEHREIYRGRIFSLAVDRVTLPSGHTVSMEVVRHPGSVRRPAVSLQELPGRAAQGEDPHHHRNPDRDHREHPRGEPQLGPHQRA